MFDLNLPIEEKLRPMVVDVLKVTVVAVVIRFLNQTSGQSLGEFFSQDFVNSLLFQAVAFAFFWAVVYQSLNIRLKQPRD